MYRNLKTYERYRSHDYPEFKEKITFRLDEQKRCQGGTKYIDYLTTIFDGKGCKPTSFDDFKFALFDNVDEMVDFVWDLDDKYNMCRVVAGFSWDWKSKNNPDVKDVKVGRGYTWNTTNIMWIIEDSCKREIGSIHTTQGYDLEYVGVILGDEIYYDPSTKRVEVDKSKVKDRMVVAGSKSSSESSNQEDNVRKFMINSYKVLMSRGIKDVLYTPAILQCKSI